MPAAIRPMARQKQSENITVFVGFVNKRAKQTAQVADQLLWFLPHRRARHRDRAVVNRKQAIRLRVDVVREGTLPIGAYGLERPAHVEADLESLLAPINQEIRIIPGD